MPPSALPQTGFYVVQTLKEEATTKRASPRKYARCAIKFNDSSLRRTPSNALSISFVRWPLWMDERAGSRCRKRRKPFDRDGGDESINFARLIRSRRFRFIAIFARIRWISRSKVGYADFMDADHPTFSFESYLSYDSNFWFFFLQISSNRIFRLFALMIYRVYKHGGFIDGTRVDSKTLSIAIFQNLLLSISPLPAVELDNPCALPTKVSSIVSKIVGRHLRLRRV